MGDRQTVDDVTAALRHIENAHDLLRVRLTAPDLEPMATRKFTTRQIAALLVVAATSVLEHLPAEAGS